MFSSFNAASCPYGFQQIKLMILGNFTSILIAGFKCLAVFVSLPSSSSSSSTLVKSTTASFGSLSFQNVVHQKTIETSKKQFHVVITNQCLLCSLKLNFVHHFIVTSLLVLWCIHGTQLKAHNWLISEKRFSMLFIYTLLKLLDTCTEKVASEILKKVKNIFKMYSHPC